MTDIVDSRLLVLDSIPSVDSSNKHNHFKQDITIKMLIWRILDSKVLLKETVKDNILREKNMTYKDNENFKDNTYD